MIIFSDCMFMSKLYVCDYVHAACNSTCCVSMSILIWACSMDKGTQHGHGHTAWKGVCSMDMDMQQGPGHTAWMWPCSIDMGMQHEHGLHNGNGHAA
jgi:hypothetical protein